MNQNYIKGNKSKKKYNYQSKMRKSNFDFKKVARP